MLVRFDIRLDINIGKIGLICLKINIKKWKILDLREFMTDVTVAVMNALLHIKNNHKYY
jgi:hypothetical protein